MRSCKAVFICLPNNSIRPESGAVMFTIMRIVVVLPAPFGPIRPKTRPGRTCKLRSLTAVNPPKRLVTRSRTSVGFVSSIFSACYVGNVSVVSDSVSEPRAVAPGSFSIGCQKPAREQGHQFPPEPFLTVGLLTLIPSPQMISVQFGKTSTHLSDQD